MSKLQERPSALKREHRALRKMKFINSFFLCLWVIFALLDQDCESGSTAGLEYDGSKIASARFPGEMKGPRCELMLSGRAAAVLKKGDAAGGAQLRGLRQTEPRRLHQL
jgi:hypothetical protein